MTVIIEIFAEKYVKRSDGSDSRLSSFVIKGLHIYRLKLIPNRKNKPKDRLLALTTGHFPHKPIVLRLRIVEI